MDDAQTQEELNALANAEEQPAEEPSAELVEAAASDDSIAEDIGVTPSGDTEEVTPDGDTEPEGATADDAATTDETPAGGTSEEQVLTRGDVALLSDIEAVTEEELAAFEADETPAAGTSEEDGEPVADPLPTTEAAFDNNKHAYGDYQPADGEKKTPPGF